MLQRIEISPDAADRLKKAVPWPARLFVLSGVVALAIASYSTFLTVRAATWPTAEAEILRSEMKYARPADSAAHLDYQILYSYHVDGLPYTGTRVRFGAVDEFFLQLEDLLRLYRRGSRHVVYYNPDAPSISTLKAGFSPGLALLFALGLGFVVLGWWLLRWRRSVAFP